MSQVSLCSQLSRALTEKKIVTKDATWLRLDGGRTNTCWRVLDNDIDIVCKLFQEGECNPLFPNSPHDEFSALEILKSTDLSPDPIALLKTPLGVCVLYTFLEGESISGSDAREVGQALARLHSIRVPPNFSLRRLSTLPTRILQNGIEILEACSSAAAKSHRNLQPDVPDMLENAPVLLHGDLVPANIIRAENNVRFIDWQCPAIGDPCEDIATFLSPAMQNLYAKKPLNRTQKDDFLHGYGNSEIKERYQALESLFHWRMAAYCLWKVEGGSIDYAKAHALEMEAFGLETGFKY